MGSGQYWRSGSLTLNGVYLLDPSFGRILVADNAKKFRVEQRVKQRRNHVPGDSVDHRHLMEKLIANEGDIKLLRTDLHGINCKLDPIVKGIGSIAFAFKGLLLVGAASAAFAGILHLWGHVDV
jgi:hypothetical protein